MASEPLLDSDEMEEGDDDFDVLFTMIESKLTEPESTVEDQRHSIKRKIEERLERKRLIEEYGFIEDF